MKIEYEIVQPDEGSSFRLLHHKVCASMYSWQYHYHPEYEIVCVPYGHGTRHVGNHLGTYENGDLVLIGSNLPHSGFGLNGDMIHEEIVVQIKEEVLSNFLLALPEMAAISNLLEKAKCGVHFIGEAKEKATRKLSKLIKLSPFEKFVELMSILQFLATSSEFELLNPDILMSSVMKKNNVRLQNVFNYIEKNFHKEINIKMAASTANLSIPSFCNYFKKTVNITFTDFLNRYRIQRACLFLQQDKSISEVCFSCGYNNVPYFNKVFKSILKKTPSEFKKEKMQLANLDN